LEKNDIKSKRISILVEVAWRIYIT